MSDYQLCRIKRFMPEPLRPEVAKNLEATRIPAVFVGFETAKVADFLIPRKAPGAGTGIQTSMVFSPDASFVSDREPGEGAFTIEDSYTINNVAGRNGAAVRANIQAVLQSPEALLHLGLPGNMSLQDFEKMVYVLKGEKTVE